MQEPSFQDVADALSLGLAYRALAGADGRHERFLRVGAACLPALGVSAEALLADGSLLCDLILPEDRERLGAEQAASLAAWRAWSIEIRIRKPDGQLRWFRISGAPGKLTDGGAIWDGLMVDITESRARAEQLIQESRRFEQALELTGMGVYHWDQDHPGALLCSDQLYAIHGVSPQTPLSVAWILARVHPEDRRAVWEASRAGFQASAGGDCAFEHRIIRPDGEVRWVLQHQRIRRDAGGLKSVLGAMLDITERRKAEERRRLQMRELAHRGKNALAVTMAMVRQTARSSSSVGDFAGQLMAKLDSMARAQDAAIASGGAPAPLLPLARLVLEAFDGSRFDLDPGLQALTVPGEVAAAMSLLLHELATNAVKYGALSNSVGRVSFSRVAAPEGSIAFEWRESGGPPVERSIRNGFGMRLLAAALQDAGGRVDPTFAREGFVARMEIPAD